MLNVLQLFYIFDKSAIQTHICELTYMFNICELTYIHLKKQKKIQKMYGCFKFFAKVPTKHIYELTYN